ncbi:MAG: hypothetical protein JWN22_413 [Nocardioides sp.]|nr:hypothetical protein [Nocardioides sp.]
MTVANGRWALISGWRQVPRKEEPEGGRLDGDHIETSGAPILCG